MHFERKVRSFITIAYFVCALGVSIQAYRISPMHTNLLLSIIFFSVFVSITELLAVGISDYNNNWVSPTAPVLWAATALMGPWNAIIVCICGVLTSQILMFLSGYLARKYEKDAKQPRIVRLPAEKGLLFPQFKKMFFRLIIAIGSIWKSRYSERSGEKFFINISRKVFYVGYSGLIYIYLGGKIHLFDRVIESYSAGFTGFVLPFILMAVTYLLLEQGIVLIGVALANNAQNSFALSSPILSIRLYFVEYTWPILKAKMLFVFVGLMLAYLYKHIGFFGIMLALMPMLALRDIFKQWVEERRTYVDTITALATYMQRYHPYTRGHLKRVAEMSEALARELKLPLKSIRQIKVAGFLHDIGKIAVSEEILDKPGKLNEEEWEQIKRHPVKGAEIISHLEYMQEIESWIKYHHKWYNGSGYPANDLKGSSIPVESTVIAVADAFDAMTDDRELLLEWQCDNCGYKPESDERPDYCPKCGTVKVRFYREPRSLQEAVGELEKGSGTQFHPEVVEAFLNIMRRLGALEYAGKPDTG